MIPWLSRARCVLSSEDTQQKYVKHPSRRSSVLECVLWKSVGRSKRLQNYPSRRFAPVACRCQLYFVIHCDVFVTGYFVFLLSRRGWTFLAHSCCTHQRQSWLHNRDVWSRSRAVQVACSVLCVIFLVGSPAFCMCNSLNPFVRDQMHWDSRLLL